VDWIDSASHSGWHTEDEAAKDYRAVDCQSVGFVVKETDRELILALSRSPDADFAPWSGAMCIPKVAIRKRRILK
jgi:hypothetical protein